MTKVNTIKSEPPSGSNEPDKAKDAEKAGVEGIKQSSEVENKKPAPAPVDIQDSHGGEVDNQKTVVSGNTDNIKVLVGIDGEIGGSEDLSGFGDFADEAFEVSDVPEVSEPTVEESTSEEANTSSQESSYDATKQTRVDEKVDLRKINRQIKKHEKELAQLADKRELSLGEQERAEVLINELQQLAKTENVELTGFSAKNSQFTAIAKKMFPKYAKLFDDEQFSDQVYRYLLDNPEIELKDLKDLFARLETDPDLSELPDNHKLKDLARLLGPRIIVMLQNVDAAEDLIGGKSIGEVMKDGSKGTGLYESIYSAKERGELEQAYNYEDLQRTKFYRDLEERFSIKNFFSQEDIEENVQNNPSKTTRSKTQSKQQTGTDSESANPGTTSAYNTLVSFFGKRFASFIMNLLGPGGIYNLLRSMGISETILANDPMLRPYIVDGIEQDNSNISKEEALIFFHEFRDKYAMENGEAVELFRAGAEDRELFANELDFARNLGQKETIELAIRAVEKNPDDPSLEDFISLLQGEMRNQQEEANLLIDSEWNATTQRRNPSSQGTIADASSPQKKIVSLG